MPSHPQNTLYFGDCLDVMREDIPTESVDLIYLDPPFNSKRIYNAFIGGAQWVAFEDTWRWHEAVDDFHEVASDVAMGDTMEGLKRILGEGANLAYLSYMANRLRECWRVLKLTGSLYLHCDPTMSHYLKVVMDAVFGRKNFRNEIVWCYSGGGIPRGDYPRKHDTIFRYSRGKTAIFNIARKSYKINTQQVGIHSTYSGANNKIDLKRGTPLTDWWTDLPTVTGWNPERIGYPTQKPLALLKRIIRASSNPGDVVLDPFCGCGTTVHAAHNLGRRWTGIDICVNACKVIQERLEGSLKLDWSDIEFMGLPKTIPDAHELAALDKFRFERWAASLVDGMEANKRQRGDKGIDGKGRLAIRKGKFIDLVSQVKGGHTGPGDVQAFNGARQQAGADLGIFTCFEDRVTPRMRDAAAGAGLFMETPVVQIYTVDDFFKGLKPKMPLAA